MFNWRNFMLAALLAIIIVFQDMLLDDLVITLFFYPIDNRVNGGVILTISRITIFQFLLVSLTTETVDGAPMIWMSFFGVKFCM